jgi:hypothetical protein
MYTPGDVTSEMKGVLSPEGAPANVGLAQILVAAGLHYQPLDLAVHAVALRAA